MKKILVLFLFLILFCTPSAFAKKSKIVIPDGSGYVGTLPDPTAGFEKQKEEISKPIFDLQNGFNDQNYIKPAPTNDPAFINIIMKKDKTSQYINDLRYIIPIVESLQNCIEDKENVQKFNAKSYYLKQNVEYFRNKYKDKAESSYISFKDLMNLNTEVQSIAQLRLESEVYSPYVTTEQSGNIFTQNNINVQLDYLLEEIRKTLVILKEAS